MRHCGTREVTLSERRLDQLAKFVRCHACARLLIQEQRCVCGHYAYFGTCVWVGACHPLPVPGLSRP